MQRSMRSLPVSTTTRQPSTAGRGRGRAAPVDRPRAGQRAVQPRARDDRTTTDEWRLFVALDQLIGGPRYSAVNYQTEINDTLGVPAAAAAAIAAQYPLSDYSSPPVALGAVGTDAIFACPGVTAEESLATYVPDVRVRVQRRQRAGTVPGPGRVPLRRGARLGAPVPVHPDQHGVPGDADPVPAAARRGHAERVDEPGHAGAPGGGWPRFTGGHPQWQSLVPPRPQQETDFAAEHHCAFWAAAG